MTMKRSHQAMWKCKFAVAVLAAEFASLHKASKQYAKEDDDSVIKYLKDCWFENASENNWRLISVTKSLEKSSAKIKTEERRKENSEKGNEIRQVVAENIKIEER